MYISTSLSKLARESCHLFGEGSSQWSSYAGILPNPKGHRDLPDSIRVAFEGVLAFAARPKLDGAVTASAKEGAVR